ncbi:DUF6343 family protein [Streptomyces sp. NBC_01433]|uniref:DUF6343 family protein n=1 Tax=Streptomyces sp. NBC_01433 TaxID=2903864 RepID=UPI00225BF883|nr:DUF6343 family protein [Streptomyces sp. NBC_01433]MCX4678028.1 DUF6343 family protein [Streptomyces sp. NBC_01433]
MLVGEAIRMRTGSEPATARSALRMRLWLSLWGTIWALFGLVAFVLADRPGWAAACGALLMITVLDFCVVVHRIHQGARYQPGRNTPPYEPGHGGHDRPGRPHDRAA